jgi:hypothetical protein
MNKYLKISALLTVMFSILLSGCGTVTSTRITATSTPSTLTTLPVSSTPSTGINTPTSTAAVTSTSTEATVTSVPATSTATTLTPTSPVTTSLLAVPALYQPLYNQLQGYITNSITQITAQWDGTSYPVNYSAELLTADTNAGPGILQSSEQQTMINELNGEAAMGVKAITVEIGCPVFDPNFYIYSGQTAAQAQQTVQSWLSYYQSLAQAIHSRGLKMIVESNPLLSYYISSSSSFNPGAYYKSLTFAAYEQLRSQHNIIIAQQIKPDYLILQTEPQTDAVNDFRPELNNAPQDVAMITGFVNDLNNAGITGLHTSLLLGSGAGTWQPDWKSYFTGLVAISGLDKIDTHIYNLQPGVNQLGEVAIAEQIADMAHAAGKGVTMSEFWFHKSTALVGLTENGDSLADIRVRDMFDFWAPLDQQSFQMLSDLANYKHFDFVSAFGHYNWFTLIDYTSLQAVPVYPPSTSTQNTNVDAQITTILNQAAKQALASGQLSPVGKAYKTVIFAQPK